jgi:hypothetical protein
VVAKDVAASWRVGASVGRLLGPVNQNIGCKLLEFGKVTYSGEGQVDFLSQRSLSSSVLKGDILLLGLHLNYRFFKLVLFVDCDVMS